MSSATSTWPAFDTEFGDNDLIDLNDLYLAGTSSVRGSSVAADSPRLARSISSTGEPVT